RARARAALLVPRRRPDRDPRWRRRPAGGGGLGTRGVPDRPGCERAHRLPDEGRFGVTRGLLAGDGSPDRPRLRRPAGLRALLPGGVDPLRQRLAGYGPVLLA